MALIIQYYSGDKMLCAERAPSSACIPDAVETARGGLLRHNARHAQVIDVGHHGKLVGMVHRDVLP
jgi:hypothetical protein